MCPRRCRGLTEGETARAVRQRLWSSGVPPARRQQGRVKSRHAALRSAYRVMAECRRSATMSADVGGDGVTRPLARSGWRRCSGAGMASVEDEVRRADPLSVNPGQRPGREDEEICTAGRCRCRCRAGVRNRRRSAAHVCWCMCPRRCRGLTEGVTARAVGLWHYCARRSSMLARSDSGTAARGGDGGGETAPLRCVLIWWREAGLSRKCGRWHV